VLLPLCSGGCLLLVPGSGALVPVAASTVSSVFLRISAVARFVPEGGVGHGAMLAMRIWGKCWSWWLKTFNLATQELTAEGGKVSTGKKGLSGFILLSGGAICILGPVYLEEALTWVWPHFQWAPEAMATAVLYVILIGGWASGFVFWICTAILAERIYVGEGPRRMAGRIKRLSSALAEASVVSDEIKALLTAREATLELLAQQAADWETLADMNKERAQAVTTLVDSVMEKRVRHLDRMGWFYLTISTGIAFFIGRYADQIKITK
jgi:hypothetical protein